MKKKCQGKWRQKSFFYRGLRLLVRDFSQGLFIEKKHHFRSGKCDLDGNWWYWIPPSGVGYRAPYSANNLIKEIWIQRNATFLSLQTCQITYIPPKLHSVQKLFVLHKCVLPTIFFLCVIPLSPREPLNFLSQSRKKEKCYHIILRLTKFCCPATLFDAEYKRLHQLTRMPYSSVLCPLRREKSGSLLFLLYCISQTWPNGFLQSF